jgi:hypothetical protein
MHIFLANSCIDEMAYKPWYCKVSCYHYEHHDEGKNCDILIRSREMQEFLEIVHE